MTKVEYGIGPGGQYGQTVTYDFGNGVQTKCFSPMPIYQSGEIKYNTNNNGSRTIEDSKRESRIAREIGEQKANNSELLNAVKNGEDWHEAADIAEAIKDSNSEIQYETLNHTYLFSIREALKKKDYDVAWDLAVHMGRRVEEGEKGFVALSLAVQYGYDDIYFFMIDKFKNPRALWHNFNLLDRLDQGVSFFGDNERYQRIKNDLRRFNLKIHGRKETSDFPCCFIC